jgi:putative beta barrel porin BBP7
MKRSLALVLSACLGATGMARAGGDAPPPSQPAPPASPYMLSAPVSSPPSADGNPSPSWAASGSTANWAADPGSDGSDRVWADAEYLLWWMKGDSVPPLITASPAGTPRALAGVLGGPTTILFGDANVNSDARSGGRFALGFWLNDCKTIGLEGDFFLLESKSSGFAASSNGNPILARPFVDALTGQQASQLIAFPGLSTGSVGAFDTSAGLVGADALLRCSVCCGCASRLDVVGGYRYLRFADHLGVAESLVSTSPASTAFIPVGTSLAVTDAFDAQNEFNGFDVGLRGEVERGRWVLSGRADVALGDNHQVLDVNGSTTVSVPGVPPPVTSVGGLLALESNIGRFSRDRFVAIPEFGGRIGYKILPRVEIFADYTFLFWGDVVRAGNQIDLTVNPNLLPPVVSPPGPFRPAPRFDNSSFWTQGIGLGLEARF